MGFARNARGTSRAPTAMAGDRRCEGIEFKYLGYYKNWVPQEAYYYAQENTGFEANRERTEGT